MDESLTLIAPELQESQMSDNPTPKQFREHYESLIQRHRAWLKQSPEGWRLKRWNQLLKDQPEPALCEAFLREFLSDHVDELHSAEDRSNGGPDFLCTRGKRRFYVESTCLTVDSVFKKTGLTYHARTACAYNLLTPLFFGACVEKAGQCSKRSDAPCLLAISTLHHAASALCFGDVEVEWILISEPDIRCTINTRTGQPVGEPYEATDMRLSAFLRPGREGLGPIESARRSISGLLLCGFGIRPPAVRGVLNTQAVRRLDRCLLPEIPFCRLVEEDDDETLRVEWLP